MKTNPNKTLSILMLLLGVLLVGFSAGRWLAPLCAWIGPILIIRYARDHKVRRGFLFVTIANIFAFIIGFGLIWANWGAPAIPIFGILYGILWSLPYLADRLMFKQFRGFSSTLIYPLAATTLEFLIIHTSPLGTWGATGFTQYGNLPLMQLASVTGMIGITFLMGWFASITNWTWEHRDHGRQVLRGLVAFGAVMASVLVFGYLRLTLTATSEVEQTIRVAGITTRGLDSVLEQTSGMSDAKSARPVLQAYTDVYFAETVLEAQAGAEVIVWPEANAATLDIDEASLIDRAQEVARTNGIYLALPILTVDSDNSNWLQNKLLLIDPSGATVMEHIKYGGAIIESTQVGDGVLQTVDTSFGVLSGVICYDADYPAVMQQAGRNGTGLMLVPSKDWFEIDPTHTQMAVFRAIENGMSLVRQTDLGLSIAVDPYGRVLAQTDYFGASDHTLVAQVPVKHVTTVYTLFGRYLEWLAPIGLLFLVIKASAGRNESMNFDK